MESMGQKKPRPRRSFTPEFTAEIVELCQRGDRSIGQAARDFDLTETAVREWVKLSERDAGTRVGGELTSAEREELNQLRQDHRRLKEEVVNGQPVDAGAGSADSFSEMTCSQSRSRG